MSRWLIKTDPRSFSFDDLQDEGCVAWGDVTNPLARSHLRRMRKGDRVLVYHMGRGPGVVGVARVTASPYPDPERRDTGLQVVDLAPVRALPSPVLLRVLRADPELADWELLRVPRLCVLPVPSAAWAAVMARAEAPGGLRAR